LQKIKKKISNLVEIYARARYIYTRGERTKD